MAQLKPVTQDDDKQCRAYGHRDHENTHHRNGMVFGPQPWPALTDTTGGQNQRMHLIDLLARTGQEGDHLTMACLVR
jgi:hypothetical protein